MHQACHFFEQELGMDAVTMYLRQSHLWERELVDFIARCQSQAASDDSLSEIAATLARRELRRCLQARTLVRRLNELPVSELATALRTTGLGDHASALVGGNWAAAGLLIV